MNERCHFSGCTHLVCDNDALIMHLGARFCQEHSDEIDRYLKDENVDKLRDFWQRASGLQATPA